MSELRERRLAELIKEEVSDIVKREIKDPRIGFVTVTDVEVSGDLQSAKIYISVYGDEQQQADTMQGLASATGFIRSLIGARIKVKHTPEIRFVLDRSVERGARVFEKLKELGLDGDDGK